MLCNYVEHKKVINYSNYFVCGKFIINNKFFKIINYQVKCEQYLPKANNLKSGEYTIQHFKTISWPSFEMIELRISNVSHFTCYLRL